MGERTIQMVNYRLISLALTPVSLYTQSLAFETHISVLRIDRTLRRRQIPSKITCKDRHQKKQCSPQNGDRAKPRNGEGSAMYLSYREKVRRN